MSKIINQGKEAREKLIAGVDIVANTVGCSLGPRGRNVVIGTQYGSPQIVNDGVTIAKNIELKDPLENAGAKLLQEVSSKTNDSAGDGTTTASVLAQAIIHEGLKALDEGINPIQMKDGINKAAQDVVKYIEEKAIAVDETKLEQVATVSAGNNTEIGKLIADAIKQVGDDGVVTVEESKTSETSLKSADGIQIDKGYISPYFVTDPERQEASLDNPYILLVNKKINLITDVIPIMEQIARDGRSVLLIAEDVEGEALAGLVVNTVRKVLRCVAIKAPGFGDRRKYILEDLAILTGGIAWTEELGVELSQIGPNFLGQAKSVTVRKDETIIVVDDSTKEEVEKRVAALKTQLETAESDYEKEKLEERIAKLAGGGYTLFEAQKALRQSGIGEEEKDYWTGYDILIRSLSVPIAKIAENAGVDPNKVIEECNLTGLGYNALTRKYENLLESGVIDPAKVTKSALVNAASIAGMLLTTEASIVDEPLTQENAGFVPQQPMMM